ncbi:hypothetical protein ACS0TY_017453 [Phlomoides rotata]
MENDHSGDDEFYQMLSYQLTRGKSTPSSTSQCHINLNIKFEIKFMDPLIGQTEETIHDSATLAFDIIGDELTVEETKSLMEDIFSDIDSMLTCLPVSTDGDGEFIPLAMMRIFDVFSRRWHRHAKVPVDVDLYILIKIEDVYHDVFDFSEDEDEDYSLMIPSTDSSVQSLLKEIDCGDIKRESCCICLEELSEELLLMPCEHVFHGGCIKGWLSTSHYCPICRFEMPAATEY